MKCRIEISDGATRCIKDSHGKIINIEWNVVKTYLGSVTKKNNGYPRFQVSLGDDLKFRVNYQDFNNFILIPTEEHKKEFVRVIPLK